MPKQYSHGGRVGPGQAAGSGSGASGLGASGLGGRGEVDGRAPRSLRQRFSALGNLRPFLRLIWQIHPAMTAATLALRLLRALLPVATLFVGKLIIDEVVRLGSLPAPPAGLQAWLDSGLADQLLWLLAGELALAILSDLLGRMVSLLESLLAELFANKSSVDLMEHAATLDLEDFEDSEIQDQLERARRQAAGRSGLLGQLFGQAQDVVTIVAFAAGLVFYAPWLIVLLVLAVVPAFLGENHFNAQGYELAWRRTPARRELDYLRSTGASVETAKEVKIFGLEGYLIERYRAIADDLYLANKALAVKRAGWGGLLTAAGTLGYYAAYAFLAWRTLSGELSIGDLTFLSGSFRRLRNLLEGLLIGFSQVAGQALYLDDLFSFFDLQPEIVSRPGAAPFPRPISQGFVFEDVGFRYPGAERWAVRHLSFTLAAGEVLALVGENGAGKTTLVKLLARLYEPDEGRILLDGRDLRDYDLASLRSRVGVIFQDFVRYYLTAGENIAVGRIEAKDDRARIEEAAERSLAAEVIARLPLGYDQLVGKRFKGGIELSGGEWQKIAIARAYMRAADVLILDEPTSALDARSEFEVFQRFAELSAGKTAVLISHRFSTVRQADRILVLAGGEIEAVGTHQELMLQKGRYAELFELQAAGLR